jgi:hypothetical protein
MSIEGTPLSKILYPEFPLQETLDNTYKTIQAIQDDPDIGADEKGQALCEVANAYNNTLRMNHALECGIMLTDHIYRRPLAGDMAYTPIHGPAFGIYEGLTVLPALPHRKEQWQAFHAATLAPSLHSEKVTPHALESVITPFSANPIGLVNPSPSHHKDPHNEQWLQRINQPLQDPSLRRYIDIRRIASMFTAAAMNKGSSMPLYNNIDWSLDRVTEYYQQVGQEVMVGTSLAIKFDEQDRPLPQTPLKEPLHGLLIGFFNMTNFEIDIVRQGYRGNKYKALYKERKDLPPILGIALEVDIKTKPTLLHIPANKCSYITPAKP